MPELAELLRAWRLRLTPADVGLPPGAGRRLTGLRRSEVAVLADLSTDYVVRLEQGRSDSPSAPAVAALAEALRLTPQESGQLHAAAGLPAPRPARVPTYVPPVVRGLLDNMPGVAVGVYTLPWTMLAANPAWVSLFGPVTPGNLVYEQFTGTAPTPLRPEADTRRFERALVTDVRAALLRYPDDPSLQALIASLRRESPRFDTMWSEGVVTSHRKGPKTSPPTARVPRRFPGPGPPRSPSCATRSRSPTPTSRWSPTRPLNRLPRRAGSATVPRCTRTRPKPPLR
ncbi:MmyB family transcriptional regulator [Paractinoplanes lichenicola]|uniref:Helix-turn-helix domain-containing protein n=1 Tax=Paractinoplanes lichenicola TaxID=2802976 RepID=A0ABS1VZP5_9ACTN|nr:helix-turn-helix domain-containing protein [Actinoplanes lichenicola]MBL7259929.1 helix-turn-helix domain-containing protein [Actinoplanes lichenicola]